MPYIYLLCAIVTSAMLAICGSLFNKKNHRQEGLGHIYNLVGATSNFLTWVIIFAADPSWEPAVLPYSLLYGTGYALFWVGLTGALQSGSSALSGFIKQIAFVFVAIWGFCFWADEPTLMMVFGIVLIAAALFLCLVPLGKGTQKGTIKVTGKWLLYALLMLAGNAGCSIIQRTQQMQFSGEHGSFLMVTATFIAAVINVALCVKDEKSEWPTIFKNNWYFPTVAGSCSALCNLFMILMVSTTLAPGVIYPSIAIGGLTLTTLVSIGACKEKLKPSQWVGMAIGAVALYCLNV